MALIGLEGAVDLHIHSAPCLAARLVDDEQAAKGAADYGLSAIMLKCHHESTVSRAHNLDRRFGALRVFGGIVLNHFVGGINPSAVEAALRLGAREIWMPSKHSESDARAGEISGGTSPTMPGVAGGRSNPWASTNPGITVLDVKDGHLKPDVLEILALIRDADAILGTSHLTYDEQVMLLSAAKDIGVKKILITHPYFQFPKLSLEQLRHLVSFGAIAEFGYCTISPASTCATVADVAKAIGVLGIDKCVIMSDCGQLHNPPPQEALRIFGQCLHEKGLSESDVMTLVRDNPKRLLDMDE